MRAVTRLCVTDAMFYRSPPNTHAALPRITAPLAAIFGPRSRSRSIVILGESHARGIASEHLQQFNHQVSATGYVKPNSGLTELLRSAKSDINKLSRRDVVIVIGGSNDIGKSELNTNLTSIVKFLDALSTRMLYLQRFR